MKFSIERIVHIREAIDVIYNKWIASIFFHASFKVLHFFINSFATWKAHCKDIFPFKRELTKVKQTEILILRKLEMGVKFVCNILQDQQNI